MDSIQDNSGRKPEVEHKKFTRKEIAERNTKNDAVFIIDNVVYDVTKFLDEHPGGHEVLVNAAGRDASEDFDDVGHSFDAKELMRKFAVGHVADADRVEVKKRPTTWEVGSAPEETGFLGSWQLPLVLGIVITVLYTFLFA